jgi:hypothetical protein
MQQRQIMTASPASLWRLRVAYLTWESSHAVLVALEERVPLLVSAAWRRKELSGALASYEAQIHLLNILVATWIAPQQLYERLFKEVELASSTEGQLVYRTHALGFPDSHVLYPYALNCIINLLTAGEHVDSCLDR